MNIKLKNALSKLEKSKDLAVRTYEEWSVLDEHVGHEELGITKENLRDCVAQSKEDIETFEIAIQAIKEKIERQENKPLTLEQLEKMVDKPIWCSINKKWGVLGIKEVNIGIETQQRFVVGFNYGWEWFSDVNTKPIYKHKPVEEMK